MRDRTLEIKPEMGSAQPVATVVAVEEPDDPNSLKAFFNELEGVKCKIVIIKTCIQEIKSLHDRALNNVISEQENAQIGKELEVGMDKANKIAGEIRSKLKEMDGANKALKKSGKSGDINVRVNQHGLLTKSFLDVMMDYKALQESYQGKYKERMQRQALVVNPSASGEEVERMIEGGNNQQLFSGQIMHAGQRNEAKKALQDIQNKHKDVMKIEKSIIELQQLFMDLSVLLAAQGELIDTITVHVDNAVQDTEDGVGELKQAVKLQKRNRKRMCLIIGGICLLIIVVGLIIYFTTKK